MFARFIGGRGAADFEIRVIWMDAPGAHGPLRRLARGESVFGPGNRRGTWCSGCGTCRSRDRAVMASN
jgi:hypothetical protein